MSNSTPNPNSCQVKDEWGKFLSQGFNWDWFGTLTFRGEVGDKGANIKFSDFVRQVRHRCGHRVEFVRVTEQHKFRNVPHYHFLMGNVPDSVRRMGMVDWWWGKGYGIARVEKYDNSKGAGHYLGKYLLKQNSEILISRGLNKLARGNG